MVVCRWNPRALLRKAFARWGITCAEAVQNDACPGEPAAIGRKADRILCDVPCSGLGVIAKKPDIRYKDLDGIENLLAQPAEDPAKWRRFICRKRPFGVFYLYSQSEENQEQVKTFLENNPRFHVAVPPLQLPGHAAGANMGTVLPHKTATDGFFAAILENRKAEQ